MRDGADPAAGTVRIRPIRPADAAGWAELRHALWPDESRPSLRQDAARRLGSRIGRDYRRAGMAAMVFVAAGRGPGLAGFAEVDLRPFADGCRTSPVGYLEGWYVAPAFRRRGVGRALVAAAEGWARAHGCREFASDTGLPNRISQRAHRALGFEETERLVMFRRPIRAARRPVRPSHEAASPGRGRVRQARGVRRA